MGKSDVGEIIKMLGSHESFATCQIKNCEECEKIKTFGKSLWSRKQIEKTKPPLQRIKKLTKGYYCDAVKKGYSMLEIAEAFEMTKSMIQHWLKKNKLKHGDILKSRNIEILKLHEKGNSYEDIADKYNLTGTAVRHIIYKEVAAHG